MIEKKKKITVKKTKIRISYNEENNTPLFTDKNYLYIDIKLEVKLIFWIGIAK